ncbi:pituitary homeobox 3-like [Dreissena polymorpha]|uniref:Homeobox domain-containing protein n=1 Tax=Dreissena polymorpha TaxID=45954 RepID=A0A9D4EAC9_DREPO|nr:pituitary homeobox 3-like [Dreissena polymorpha]KAH3775678.1 hypothetical protein DPMN_177084 [Dreissena polymorpha]
MLSEHQQPIKDVSETVREKSNAARYFPYNAAYTVPSKKATHQISRSTIAVESEIDQATDLEERGETPNTTDCSMSSLESLSPISFSSASDIASQTGSSSDASLTDAEAITNPESTPDQKKKKMTRTNYTKKQLKMLMKIFHENPYPDSKVMENIAKDFGVKETNIKIWFQNKRARWRRRVENMNNSMQSYTPSATMMSPYASYGSLYNQLMSQQVPGYQNYQWMQNGALSPNNNNQLSAVATRVSLSTSSFSPFSLAQSYPQMVNTTSYQPAISSYPQKSMTSPQLNACNQNNLMYSPTMLHSVY